MSSAIVFNCIQRTIPNERVLNEFPPVFDERTAAARDNNNFTLIALAHDLLYIYYSGC